MLSIFICPLVVIFPVEVIVPVVAIFCDPKSGATLVPAIAADALTSSFTIVPLTIFALATVTSVGQAPAAILDVAIESALNLPAIVAEETLVKSSAASGKPA